MSTIEVRVPQLPESVADATLVAWRKQPGDAVNRDENLVDLETDKVVLEVPAPVSGVLREIKVQNGTTVTGGQVLAVIDEGAVALAVPASTGEVGRRPGEVAAPPAAVGDAKKDSDKLAPSVRRLVEEHKLAPADIAGSGRDGRITKGDVLTHLADRSGAPAATPVPAMATRPAAAPAPSLPAGERGERRVPMTRLRARIAERLVQAQSTAAMLTTFNEVDLKAVNELRARYKDKFEKEHGARLGFMSFFVKACVEALKRFPVVNASVDGNDVVYHEYYDVGVAVSTERGLIVPVLRNADQMDFGEIEQVGRRIRDTRPGRTTDARGTDGRHVHDHQRWRIWLAAVDPDPQHAAERDTRHAQDPAAARRRRRPGRRAPHDVPRALLRSPAHRRQGSRAVPGVGEGLAGRSGAPAAADLRG